MTPEDIIEIANRHGAIEHNRKQIVFKSYEAFQAFAQAITAEALREAAERVKDYWISYNPAKEGKILAESAWHTLNCMADELEGI